MAPDDNITLSNELQRDSNRIGISLLLTDLDTGLIFAQLALEAADNPEKRSRNRLNARRAYDAVVHFRSRLDFNECTPGEIQPFEERLGRLRAALERLGESFEQP